MKQLLILLLVFGLTYINAQDDVKVVVEADSLVIGMDAPDFTLPDAKGKMFTLSSFKEKSPVVVYFYPKAGSGGCTKQACGIRDEWSKFKENNIMILGISTDTKEEIQEFVDEYSLNFPLLSDENKKVSQAYNVLKENGLAKRVTFIVDKEGKIAKIINVDNIESHSTEIFDIASKLN